MHLASLFARAGVSALCPPRRRDGTRVTHPDVSLGPPHKAGLRIVRPVHINRIMDSAVSVKGGPAVASDMAKLFSSTSCGALISRTPAATASRRAQGPAVPICLDAELSVQDACNALAEYKISSAPVFSVADGGFIGMFDYRDLVAYVLEIFHKLSKEKATASYDAEMEFTDILKRAALDRTNVPIKLVSNLSQKNHLVVVFTTTPLLTALQEFVQSPYLHRLVVLENGTKTDDQHALEKDKFVGVLSQSLICALVAENFGFLARKNAGLSGKSPWTSGDLSLKELGLVKSADVVTVDLNDTVLDALYVMHTRHTSSVAIVDKLHGQMKLEGSISMTDIKDILSSRGGWKHLYDSCFRFFAQLRVSQGLEANGSDRIPLFTVYPSTPLTSAIEKMVATRAHRVWIVSEGSAKTEVVGVLEMTDVMPVLLEACGVTAAP
ncbi:cell separation during budding [Entophlyctis luteolus]|nr:cell separation during budding [Entophlyctis luteolus]